MLRDRLVCGVRHRGITNRLLAEKELDYDKALEPSSTVPPQPQLSTQPTGAHQVNHNTLSKSEETAAKTEQSAHALLSMWRCRTCSHSVQIAVCHACKEGAHCQGVQVKVRYSRKDTPSTSRQTHKKALTPCLQ